MYSDEDINNLKQVLEVYERAHEQPAVLADNKEKSEADLLAELLRASQSDAPEVQLQPLPTFYVGTLIRRPSGDWSVWVNGELMNRKHPESAALHLRVEGVGRDNVVLAWKPEQLAHAYQRYQAVRNRAVQAAAPVASTQEQTSPQSPQAAATLLDTTTPAPPRQNAHREARSGSIEFDKDKGEFTIRLRPNQTFMAETMQLFEGRLSTSVVQQLMDPALNPGMTMSGAGGQTIPDAALTSGIAMPPGAQPATTNERALADQMMKNLQAITGLVPQRNAVPPAP